jgi:hypothetical protein
MLSASAPTPPQPPPPLRTDTRVVEPDDQWKADSRRRIEHELLHIVEDAQIVRDTILNSQPSESSRERAQRDHEESMNNIRTLVQDDCAQHNEHKAADCVAGNRGAEKGGRGTDSTTQAHTPRSVSSRGSGSGEGHALIPPRGVARVTRSSFPAITDAMHPPCPACVSHVRYVSRAPAPAPTPEAWLHIPEVLS